MNNETTTAGTSSNEVPACRCAPWFNGRSLQITGAIFDCDGTLLDSLETWRGLEGMLEREAGVTVTREERKKFATFTIPEVSRYFHEEYGLAASTEAVIGIVDDYMMAYYAHAAKPLPGVAELLEACKREGVRMSVASSSTPAYLKTGLECAGIRSYFDVVLSVEHVGAPKREPVIFHEACRLLGTDPATTWGFEDSLYAMDTLRNAGYPVVGICDEAEGVLRGDVECSADVAVDSLEDLTVAEGKLAVRL